ncbi:MAG: DUF202 domain-containing protein [Deltaproteobacteria bacterium]|nr:DUF202 domain-containing protein [Deltaproteobacteria bacterium]
MSRPLDEPAPDPPPPPAVDPRIYFAAERTLLAWVRTGLAMMGFGFVVARFGLFLREVAALRTAPGADSPHVSLLVGVALVVGGVAVNVYAAARYRSVITRLNHQQTLTFNPLSLGTVTAALLALLGVALAVYLALTS